MKATGIIRRIDDLGRVVIPKEIRRTLHLREGDPMEIFVHNGSVLFTKYNPATTFTEYVDEMLKELNDEFDLKCRNKVLALVKEIENIISDEQSEMDG